MIILSRMYRRKDCGVVLLLALVALLLISAVGAAILFMTATESSLVGYQRTTTRAHQGGLGGLEEGRSRLSTSDPNYFGGTTLTLLFPQRVGDVLYITNPGAGDNVQPWTPGNDFYDREYVTEWGAAIETVAACGGDPFVAQPVAPCGWPATSDQAAMAAAALVLPELPYKWVRITILTEQAANRDIDGDGALDPAIPVTWDSRSNRMNILVDPAAQVDREGDGIMDPLDTDLDGTVEREERLGRYVYRITALSRVRSAVVGGAVQYAIRLVQYDVSSPFVNLDFPGAVSLIGSGSHCGQTLGPPAPPDGNAQGWGPTEAGSSAGEDQNPDVPPGSGEGGPAIGCTDPASCTDCINDINAIAHGARNDNFQGICPPTDPGCPCGDGDVNTTCTGDITGTAGPVGNMTGLQLLMNTIRGMADIVCNQSECPAGAASTPVDAPPQNDGIGGNDTIAYGGAGGSLGMCNDDPTQDITGDGVPDPVINQPKVVVMDGDITLNSSAQGGCGVLLVTGTLATQGNWYWKGIVLLIGEGTIQVTGGGNGGVQGAVVLARIYCQDGDLDFPCPCAGGLPPGQCSGDGVLAAPQGSSFQFTGGGTAGWDYNSLYINNALGSGSFQVLAYREITQ